MDVARSSRNRTAALRGLTIALIAGSVIGASAGSAAVATLHIAAPSTAPHYREITVTLTGQAGSYNTAAAYAYAGACPAKPPGSYNSKPVKPNGAFKVTLMITSGPPGTHHACGYLFLKSKPNGSNVHTSKTFKST